MAKKVVGKEGSGSATPEPVAGVREYLSVCSAPVRDDLIQLRNLVFQVAAEDPRVGPLTETLKWGEPAYLTAKTKAGTTLRLAAKKGEVERIGMFYHCQTRVAERIRELYPDTFEFDGSRGLLFAPGTGLPVEAVKGCMTLVLTYHLNPLLERA